MPKKEDENMAALEELTYALEILSDNSGIAKK